MHIAWWVVFIAAGDDGRMKIDIPAAGWILSVVSFLAGTVVPTVYEKISFDGLSVRQLPIKSVNTIDIFGKHNFVVFSTVIKIANARKESVIVEGIQAPSISLPTFSFQPVGTEFKIVTRNESFGLPPAEPQAWFSGDTSPAATSSVMGSFADNPPIIVKGDEEKLLAVGVRFSYSGTGTGEASSALFDYVDRAGLPVQIEINGKYRSFTLRIPPESVSIPDSVHAAAPQGH
jgi:hypothetical protein